ncbi:hypothetical protein AB0H63_06760 [Micromonospora echinospora]|uniref:hypothetical protein n=1 Tax=Micromonospora echinospora TaxID=1877 RepID=UPI0033DDFD49
MLLPAWGCAELLERSALPVRGRVVRAVGAAGFALVLTVIQLRYPATVEPGPAYGPVLPLLRWAVGLAVVATVLGLLWLALVGGWPGPARLCGGSRGPLFIKKREEGSPAHQKA